MDPSEEYIRKICDLYGGYYDDREEDSKPSGQDWMPGVQSVHKSLSSFQKELKGMGIKLSTAKLRKILITGDCWSTERSREVARLYKQYAGHMKPEAIRERIAKELRITPSLVSMLLPYDRVVYDLEDKSSNARRCDRWRKERGKQ